MPAPALEPIRPRQEGLAIIDAPELSKRLTLPVTWIRDQVRSRAADPIPCLRFGRYVRFRWNSPELNAWIERRAK